jgi:hypothetical protein
MKVKAERTNHHEPRSSFPSTVPPTPAEEAAASYAWERRGLLRRLIRN